MEMSIVSGKGSAVSNYELNHIGILLKVSLSGGGGGGDLRDLPPFTHPILLPL